MVDFGPYPIVLRLSFLLELWGPYEMSVTTPGWAECKARALPLYYLSSKIHLYR